MIPVLVVILAFADLAAVKLEPDLNRRSELALTHADEVIDEARQAYEAGNAAAEAADMKEVADAVALCYASLEQTHSAPRKSKYYKRAELKVSALMRRLNGFRDEVSYDFRPNVEVALKKLSDIHDELITDIMSKKK
ncbi:MAG: hypothetical protein WBE37_00220 [Bryobacteraceae bacterium]